MRTIILSTFILMSSVFSLQAQVGYGIEIGGFPNDLTSSNVEVKPKFSYRIGGFITYDTFNNTFRGSSGIYYVKRGAKLSEFLPQYADYIQQIDYSANYIEIVPFSMRFLHPCPNPNKKFKVIPVLGLYVAYGFSGSCTLTGIDNNNSTFEHFIDNLFKNSQFVDNNANYDFKGFKAFDAGAKVGIDFAYERFILRCNWTVGLNSFSSYDKRLRNSSIDISLCYLFK